MESSGDPGKAGSRRAAVLITGAAGGLGMVLVRALAPRYPLELLDRRDLRFSPGCPFYKADLSGKDALRDRLSTVDTIIHMAGIPTNDASWEALFASNVMATQYLLTAALEQGCRRVILASSVQVMNGYPRGTDIRPEMPVWPTSLYGVSKACAEAVAARFGNRSALSVICLRLGWVLARSDWRVTPFSPYLDLVLTREDFIRSICAAVDAPDSVRFGIFHILSDNRTKRLNIEASRKTLRYEPHDDAFRLARWNIRGMVARSAVRLRRSVRGVLGRTAAKRKAGREKL
jgi:uronate dehydrogenase